MEDSETALEVVCMGKVRLDRAGPVWIERQVVLVQLLDGSARHKGDIVLVNWENDSKPSLKSLCLPPPPAALTFSAVD